MGNDSSDLFVLVYASEATAPMGEDALNALLEQARAKNERLGITGLLLHRQGRFVQYLEGAEADVRAVYAAIVDDARHTNVRVLMEEQSSDRRFSSWTMGYEPLRDAPAAVPAGFRDTFADLEAAERPDQVLRALGELTLWFHVRTARV